MELNDAAENRTDGGKLGQSRDDANPRQWLSTVSRGGGKMCIGNHFAVLG
jgi:hypothetical protein